MELPRRRTGSYEPRSAVGNILAPVSGAQGSAELRSTPSSRGGAIAAAAVAATSSRPPWATELDAADAPPPQPPPNQQQHQHPHLKPSGRSPSTSRAQSQSRPPDRDPHGFSFHTPTPTPGRPPSGGRDAIPVDQLDLWSRQQQQQQQQGQHAPSPPGGSTARRASGSGDGPRLPSGNLSYGDGGGAPRLAGRGAAAAASAAAAAARVGASPARTAAPAPAPGRSTSTPKPRPVVPPKRSTSITDNVRRDWVDAGPAERRAGTGGGAAGRWDADADGDDRGSWLFAGDTEAPPLANSANKPPNRNRESKPKPDRERELRLAAVADRRRQQQQPERPASAGRASGDGYDSGGDGGRASPGDTSGGGGGLEQRPPPPPLRRPRPQSPVSGELEATLSVASGTSAAAAAAAPLLGGSGSDGMSLGHGLSGGFGGAGGAAAAAGGRGGAGAGRLGGSTSASHGEAVRQVQALQEENARLRDQMQYLERLVVAATPTAAAVTAAGGGRKGPAAAVTVAVTPTAVRPWSANNADGAAAPSMAAAAAGGVVLQQYKSQVIQLQRQVALMSKELEARARLGFEAEGALLEMASKLQELAASSSGSGGGGGGGGDAAPGAAAAAAVGLGISSAGGGGGGAGAGEALSRDRLLQLHKWSKQMLGRLRGEKSESSKLFTHQGAEVNPHAARTAPPWSSPDPRGGGGGFTAAAGDGSYAPTWLVPFLPAGGNRFLAAGGAAAEPSDDLAGAAGGGAAAAASYGSAGGAAAAAASVAAIAGGQAALLADPLLAHRLELRLAAAAPRLAALAVLVRTQLLPAMPWLGLEAADRLQAEVGEAAEGVAQAVEALTQLCALLPAGAAVFGEGPLAAEPKRRAAEVDAGRDGWLYGSPELVEAPEPPSPAVNDEGIISVPRLQAAIAPLLRDRKAGSKALADILEPVRSRSQSLASKRAVLEAELRFASRASGVHAEHVSHLMMSVGMALEECRGAKDAAAIKSYFNAAAAIRQVLEAADALELHPCEACLKSLVDVIRVHRDTLDRVPELLTNAPAADVEGRLLAKVEELHQGFKRAVSRLEAHKRRHVDALAGGSGGGGAGHGGGAEDYDDDSDHFEDDDDAGGGQEAGGGPRGGGATGSAATRRLPPAGQQSQPQQQASATKPGKPPKPRPEWQG